MQNYKEWKVWEQAHELIIDIYALTKTFPKEEVYAMTSQIRRAGSSVPANIAEGCGKYGDKNWRIT